MADEAENARPKGLLILFTSLKLLNILNDTEFRRVVNAMAAYVESGTEPDGLKPIEQLAFESQREALDGNIQAYQKTATANRENGKKGGRPRKAIKTDEFSEKPTETDGFLDGQIPADEKPTETHKNQELRIKNYTDTKVSDTTVVVNRDSVDTDLACIVQHYEAVAGSFPRSALEKLQSWRELYSTEMILLAIDKAAEAGKRSWTYVNGILSNWKREGTRTPGDVDASDENHKRQQARPGSAGGRKPAESVDDQLTRVLANMDRKRGFEQ